MRKTVLFLFLTLAPVIFAAKLDIVTRGKSNFKIGEKVTFAVTAFDDNGKLFNAGTLRLTFRKSGGSVVLKEELVDLAEKGNPFEADVSMNEPGFILMEVSSLTMPDKSVVKWKTTTPANDLGGAAIEPEKLRAAAPVPEDFDEFWANTLKAFEKTKVVVKPAPGVERAGYKVSFVEIPFPDGSGSIYGFLSIPLEKGKFPALVGVPGAGRGRVDPVPYWTPGKKAITLWLNVLPYPPARTAAEQRKLYDEYRKVLEKKNVLKGNYFYYNAGSRDTFFYKNVWAAVSRGVDFVASLPEFDGKNFAAAGNSQGGGTALAIAGLNKKISCVVASVPALCDHGGWLKERRSGWPKLHEALKGTADKASAYFDAATFASRINVPTLVSVGYIDVTCPPASVYCAYNNLKGKKEIFQMPRHGHRNDPKFRKIVERFLDTNLSR